MKFNFRSALALPCLAAVLAVTGFAHAGLISGSVYNTPPFPAGVQNPPSGPAIATLTSFPLLDRLTPLVDFLLLVA